MVYSRSGASLGGLRTYSKWKAILGKGAKRSVGKMVPMLWTWNRAELVGPSSRWRSWDDKIRR